MAEALRINTTKTVVIEPERVIPAITEVREVAQYDLTLTSDEADSLATLLHCHVGGLQRSPALQALSTALEAAGANQKASNLIAADRGDGKQRTTYGHGMTVLADLFGTDGKPYRG